MANRVISEHTLKYGGYGLAARAGRLLATPYSLLAFTE